MLLALDPEKVYTEYFFMQPDIIYLYYNLRDLAEYNYQVFNDSMANTNLVLQLYYDTQAADSFSPIDLFDDYRKEAVDALQSLYLSLPSDKKVDDKLDLFINRLNTILMDILRDTKQRQGEVLDEIPTGISGTEN
jgi:hypothetical protein